MKEKYCFEVLVRILGSYLSRLTRTSKHWCTPYGKVQPAAVLLGVGEGVG